METKDTLSSCSYSDEQDMQQMLKQAKILKGGCLNGLSALKSNFTRILEQGITKSEFERAFSHIFGEDVDTFTRTFSQNMDTLEQQLTKETILESNCQNAFRVLKTQFEKIFSSVLIKPSSLDGHRTSSALWNQSRQHLETTDLAKPSIAELVNSSRTDLVIVLQEPIYKMETKDTLSSCSNSEEQQMQQIQDKAKKSCMVSFRQLHSHLKLLSNNDLKGTRTESGFKRAFATLFGQDIETFTGTMFLYVDQLEKQLDKEEFQEIGSMAAFKVLETQFQMFIKSRMYLDDEFVVMTRNYFLQYTQLAIPKFCDTLIQHMESVKKSIDEKAKHKEEYNCSGTALKEQDTSSRSGNDAHADDANIRPIYDEESMAEVQTSAKINVFTIGQQQTEQPEFNNEGEVDQNAEQCHDTCPLPATLTDNQTTELSNQSLESENIRLKKTVAQFQKDFLRMEAHCVNLELKYQNQALKEGQHGQFSKVKSNEDKVKHDIDVIETINIELEHSVAKLLAENEQLHKEKEHLKQTYKDLFDSIKRTRVQTKDQNDSLMAQLNKKSNENADVLAQIQKKGFAIAALKNELRKLTGNSVNTKFAKSSILGKPTLQPRRNQSFVRQPDCV
ncbi:hypothetical protein Tco_0017464 [Tanacetum coccineum]